MQTELAATEANKPTILMWVALGLPVEYKYANWDSWRTWNPIHSLTEWFCTSAHQNPYFKFRLKET